MKIALFLLICSTAQAAELASDSLVCESAESILFAKQEPSLTGQPGPVVLTRAGAFVKYVEQSQKVSDMLTELAMKEGAIAGSRYRPSGTRQSATTVQAGTDRLDPKPYAKLLATCTLASGPAEVLERTPVSNTAKVRVSIKGIPAEVFIADDALKP